MSENPFFDSLTSILDRRERAVQVVLSAWAYLPREALVRALLGWMPIESAESVAEQALKESRR